MLSEPCIFVFLEGIINGYCNGVSVVGHPSGSFGLHTHLPLSQTSPELHEELHASTHFSFVASQDVFAGQVSVSVHTAHPWASALQDSTPFVEQRLAALHVSLHGTQVAFPASQ